MSIKKVHAWMRKHHRTLALAESCTGGLMAAQITEMPGASDYFLGSVVVYSNGMKTEMLGVAPSTLKHPVSRKTVSGMWKGLMQRTRADYGVAVTGVAGPTGGTKQTPIGTIWYALGRRGDKPQIGCLQMKGGRRAILHQTTKHLFQQLLELCHTHS